MLNDTRVFEANSQGGGAFGDLPEWDLSDLYASEDAAELQADLTWLKQSCIDFSNDYEGELAQLNADEMLKAVERYEAIDIIAGRIMSFAGLRYYQLTSDPERAKFMSDMQDKLTEHTTKLVFYGLEFNRLEEEALSKLLAQNAALARYKPVFDRMRAMKPYQLSDEMERFLHDQSVVGAAAWNRLFDETVASLVFTIDGEDLPLEAAANKLSEQDRDTREAAAREIARVLRENTSLFARVHNTLAKDKEIEDRWRKMPTPQTGRHLSNHVEADKLVDWTAAQEMVLSAYAEFSPKMAEIAKQFFTKSWIDAAVKPGKAPGAFAHPTVTTVHPYVMLNYLGKPRDVMTLAHELGHGVHQVLAAQQGELLSSTPLTLAETASVFGEMLTFRKLLAAAKTPQERKVLLAGKVEDMINTVVRQIAFYDFECKLHAARGEGELTPDQINAIWMSVQGESLGPVFEFMDGYETFWSYIPHFVHSPFYVYAYAFGDGLVNALYAVYEEGDPEFQAKYFDMLRAGGSKHHTELLAPFGLDASDPKFWDKGLSMISAMIDELEAMED